MTMDLMDCVLTEIRSLQQLGPQDLDPALESLRLAILLEDALGITIPDQVILDGIKQEDDTLRALMSHAVSSG